MTKDGKTARLQDGKDGFLAGSLLDVFSLVSAMATSFPAHA
jgi:hypothetical protein